MTSIPQASERFSFRLEAEKKNRIERAAAVRGLTLTDFAILTLMREAEEILRTEHILVLSDKDRDAFLAALDNPPAPNAKARKAAAKYKKARRDGELR